MIQEMACCPIGTKLLPEPMMTYSMVHLFNSLTSAVGDCQRKSLEAFIYKIHCIAPKIQTRFFGFHCFLWLYNLFKLLWISYPYSSGERSISNNNQPTNQPTNLPTNQPNQPTKPTNQPTNQLTNQPTINIILPFRMILNARWLVTRCPSYKRCFSVSAMF